MSNVLFLMVKEMNCENLGYGFVLYIVFPVEWPIPWLAASFTPIREAFANGKIWSF